MVVRRTATGYRRLTDIEYASEDEVAIDLQHLRKQPEVEGRESQDITVDLSILKPSDSGYSYHKTSPSEGTVPIALAHRSRRPAQQRFLSGWRGGALLSLVGAVCAFILNLSITLWVYKNPAYEIEDSVGTLYQGDCGKARKLNVWVHLVVNVLSTLLLEASNYCMQVLSAPSREELVRAHARRIWLHIGVPSLRNLLHIGPDRAILWILLFLSSVPLHLLFNSVVFLNLQANYYAVIPTMEDWLRGGPFNTSNFVDMDKSNATSLVRLIDQYRIYSNQDGTIKDNRTSSKYRNLTTTDCFNKYREQYVSGTGNVFLIQESPTVYRNPQIWSAYFNGTSKALVWYHNNISLSEYRSAKVLLPSISDPSIYPSNEWRCPGQRDVDDCNLPQNGSGWKPYESTVKYCIVEQVSEICRLQVNFSIAWVVIASNLVKALCMAVTLFKYKKHTGLVTTGDAVASFLDDPDPETYGRCLHSRRLVEAEWTWERTHGARKDGLGIEPEPFAPRRHGWYRAPSGYRWLSTYLLYFVGIVCGFSFMARSLSGMPKDPVKLWKVGFGEVTGRNLVNFSTSLTAGIILANLPQAVLSYLYLAFNALYTNMFVAEEWSTYFSKRKPLRVTSPIGHQRGTYWLTVPFRYAIPMTIVSGLFHWLASQSLFMVRVTLTDAKTRQIVDKQISTCGYSPMAVVLTTVTGTLIALGGLVLGFARKYPAGMPLVASCSAAISAACHPLPEDVDASVLPVQWGAVTHNNEGGNSKKQVGHCTFSSLPVERPIVGRFYA